MTRKRPRATRSRQLSPSEIPGALLSITMWLTADVVGPLDVEVLDAAWAVLRSEHPVLGGWLELGGGNATAPQIDVALQVPVDPLKSSVHHRKLAQEPIAFALRPGTELALVDVVQRQGTFLVSLAVSHVIADGRLASYWFERLWSHYTDLTSGVTPVVEPTPVPTSVEALLAQRGIGRSESYVPRSAGAKQTKLPPVDLQVWSRERIRLSAGVTNRLRLKARETESTVHGLVAGAVAMLERRHMPVASDRDIDLVVNSPVDIRNRLEPVVPVWGGTSVIGMAEAVLQVGLNSNAATLGKQVVKQLAEDLENGRVRESLLHTGEDMDSDAASVPQILTTNIGVLPEIKTPTGVKITDFLGWVQFDSKALTATLQSSWRRVAPPGALWPMYIISTFQGRLGIDMRLFLPADAADAWASELETLLVEITRSGSSSV